METVDKDWIVIQRLIKQDKAESMAELRCRPLMKPAAERLRSAPWPRKAFLPVAAALSLTIALGIFWSVQRQWHSFPSSPSPDSLLAGTFLYSSPHEMALPAGRQPSASPNFTAWAIAALQGPAAENGAPPVAGGDDAAVERGDPAAMRQHLGEAIRGNVFGEFLSRYQEFHDKEA